ncbi:hypothetical protein [Demequina sp. NBRC 110051]|uniref:hypothetical protein n=1 Tax=Demequina sp. NBRC 110051 TaxID=1570340 RepID=UPI000A068F7A|nr:hypothetical protein [Demequina sp. NBRC 110051]
MTLTINDTSLIGLPPVVRRAGTATWTIDLHGTMPSREEPYALSLAVNGAARGIDAKALNRVEPGLGDGPPVPSIDAVAELVSHDGTVAIRISRPRPRVTSIIPVRGTVITIGLCHDLEAWQLVATCRASGETVQLVDSGRFAGQVDVSQLGRLEDQSERIWDLGLSDGAGVVATLGSPAGDLTKPRGTTSFPQILDNVDGDFVSLTPYVTVHGTVAVAAKPVAEREAT